MNASNLYPLIIIFGTNIIFPISKNVYKPSFQFPNYVFFLMWLYISIVLGFVRGKSNISRYMLYTILILFTIWSILQNKRYFGLGYLCLLIVTSISILYLTFLYNEIGQISLYVFPLTVWLVIASSLSGIIYENEKLILS